MWRSYTAWLSYKLFDVGSYLTSKVDSLAAVGGRAQAVERLRMKEARDEYRGQFFRGGRWGGNHDSTQCEGKAVKEAQVSCTWGLGVRTRMDESIRSDGPNQRAAAVIVQVGWSAAGPGFTSLLRRAVLHAHGHGARRKGGGLLGHDEQGGRCRLGWRRRCCGRGG